MGADIHAVGKAAYDEHVGAYLPQVVAEAAYEVLTVGCAVARADDAQDACAVEVGGAFVEQHERRVVALTQP